MRTTVVCSIKDEGPFLVEWVTWYRMLGFSHILVVSNDCTDRSPNLLDALHAAGWITHLRHDVQGGVQITYKKLRAAKAHPVVRDADWVLVCDVDEFLTVQHAGGIAELLSVPPMPFLGMSINWRVFGTSGHAVWQDGLVHRQFTMAAPASAPQSRWMKCIAAHPAWFAALGEHGPRRLNLDLAGQPWGAPGMVWVNSAGTPVPDWTPAGDYLRMLPQPLTTHATAAINHYIIRSDESFGLKRGSAAPVSGKDRYTDDFYHRFNRNDVADTSTQPYAAQFGALHTQAMALPGVRRLHHLCCADYAARLATKAGRDVASDARYQHHMEQAG
jgi:Glycosyl transferase family 2